MKTLAHRDPTNIKEALLTEMRRDVTVNFLISQPVPALSPRVLEHASPPLPTSRRIYTLITTPRIDHDGECIGFGGTTVVGRECTNRSVPTTADDVKSLGCASSTRGRCVGAAFFVWRAGSRQKGEWRRSWNQSPLSSFSATFDVAYL